MRIEEGRSSNAVIHPDAVELVFERAVSDTEDKVIIVPSAALREGTTLDDPQLPAIIQIKHYMKNSELVDSTPGDKANPATAGLGLYMRAVPQDEVSGVANEQGTDAASAYVVLTDRATQKDLGTRMLSAHLIQPEWVQLGGQWYQVSLRYKRTYRPYRLFLEKFDFKKFVGTEMAKDYRSHIRLINPESGEDRQLEIYMNAPLRYEGETFYQSSVLQDTKNGPAKGTVLQVMRNPGWRLPYLACAMVSLGMLVHFCIMLTGFVDRQAQAPVPRSGAAQSEALLLDAQTAARAQLPALALLFVGLLDVLLGLTLVLAGFVTGSFDLDRWAGYVGLASLPTSVLVMMGGWSLGRLRWLPLAYIGSVLATTPFLALAFVLQSPVAFGALATAFVLGIPTGFWALAVLSDQTVRAAFHAEAHTRAG
jgi:hypothetical protein